MGNHHKKEANYSSAALFCVGNLQPAQRVLPTVHTARHHLYADLIKIKQAIKDLLYLKYCALNSFCVYLHTNNFKGNSICLQTVFL